MRYEYAGREYNVQMPNDPGPTVRLQVTPVGSNPPPADSGYAAGPMDQGVMPAPQPAVVAPQVVNSYPVYTAPAPAYYPYYAAPSYYPWYPPVSLSLGFGFYGGGRPPRRTLALKHSL